VPFDLTVKHTHNTNIHAPGGIRTRNPSKWSLADPRLRPLGCWYRLIVQFRRRVASCLSLLSSTWTLGFDHRTVQTVAIRNTDWAIPAHTRYLYQC
jgi:hypothetical protein